MGFWEKITSFFGGSIIEEVKDIVMEYVPSKEKKQELELKLKEFEKNKAVELKKLELDFEKENTKKVEKFQETEQVQLQQEDKYTKRARPTRQYFWLLLLFVSIPIAWFTKGEIIELPEPIYWVMLADMGVYTVSRTSEKIGSGKVGNIIQKLKGK